MTLIDACKQMILVYAEGKNWHHLLSKVHDSEAATAMESALQQGNLWERLCLCWRAR